MYLKRNIFFLLAKFHYIYNIYFYISQKNVPFQIHETSNSSNLQLKSVPSNVDQSTKFLIVMEYRKYSELLSQQNYIKLSHHYQRGALDQSLGKHLLNDDIAELFPLEHVKTSNTTNLTSGTNHHPYLQPLH